MGFGNFQHNQSRAPIAEINTTPLVDVMLVLLVIFMVTLPLVTHHLAVDLPKTDADAPISAVEPSPVELAINAQGQLLWNGVAVPDDALLGRLQEAGRNEPKPELRLYADKHTQYQRLAAVIADVQRSGLTRISLMTEPRSP